MDKINELNEFLVGFFKKIPLQKRVFLWAPFALDSNQRTFALVIYKIWKGEALSDILNEIEDDIDWHVKRDSADVMRLVHIRNSINENKRLIESLVPQFEKRCKWGCNAIGQIENPIEVFESLVKY